MADLAARLIPAVLLATLGLAAPATAQPPAAKDWALTFRDDFGGAIIEDDFDTYALDLKRWRPVTGTTDKLLSDHNPANLVYQGGMLRLVARHVTKHGKEWTSAMVESRAFRQTYGYYEVRARYAGVPGITNSFSLHTDAAAGPGSFGIDVNEGMYPSSLSMNLRGEFGDHPRSREVEVDLSRDFHTYGLEWLPGEDGISTLNFYFDDSIVHSINCAMCNQPVKIILSAAVVRGGGPITTALDGKSMDVDYIRVYQLKRLLNKPAT